MNRSYTFLFACMFYTLNLAAQQKDTTSKIYTYVEQMPKAGYDWNKYLSENLHYPDSARDHDIQGRVVVKFVVNDDGSITDEEIVRGIGGGCDEEVLRIMRNAPRWKPAMQNGKAVKAFYTLPISFKLDEPDQRLVVDSGRNDTGKSVYTFVNQMPQCKYDISQFLSNNLKYPENARRHNIEGRVVVRFVINEDGHISDCVVPRHVADDLDAEALRVVKKLPPWTPGKKNGKPVKVFYMLPISFSLGGKEESVTVSSANPDAVHELQPGEPVPGYNFNYYVATHLVYPWKARRKKIEGKVIIGCTVKKDGSISDVYLKQGIGGGCDEEALRLIANMPPWRPDVKQPTDFPITIPIIFKLTQ